PLHRRMVRTIPKNQIRLLQAGNEDISWYIQTGQPFSNNFVAYYALWKTNESNDMCDQTDARKNRTGISPYIVLGLTRRKRCRDEPDETRQCINKISIFLINSHDQQKDDITQ